MYPRYLANRTPEHFKKSVAVFLFKSCEVRLCRLSEKWRIFSSLDPKEENGNLVITG
jgi:hypothetical protein